MISSKQIEWRRFAKDMHFQDFGKARLTFCGDLVNACHFLHALGNKFALWTWNNWIADGGMDFIGQLLHDEPDKIHVAMSQLNNSPSSKKCVPWISTKVADQLAQYSSKMDL
jgi:hypothetical protein